MKKQIQLLFSIMIFTTNNFVSGWSAEYKAQQAYQNKDYATALQEYEKLFESDPYNSDYNYKMGTLLYRLDRFADAESCFERFLSQKTDEESKQKAYYNLASCYMRLHKYQEAIELYEQMLDFDPSNEKVQKNLALAKKLLQEKEDAKKNSHNDQQSDKDSGEQQSDKDSDEQPTDKVQSEEQGDQKDHSQKTDSLDQANNALQKDQKNTGHENAFDRDKQPDDHGNKKVEDSSSNNNNSQHKSVINNDDLSDQQSQDGVPREQQVSDKDSQKKSLEKQHGTQGGKEQGYKQQERVDSGEQEQENNKQDQSSASGQGVGKGLPVDKEQPKGLSGQKSILQNEYEERFDTAVDNDDRLSDQDKKFMTYISEQENAVQKNLLKINVSQQGGKKRGQKNW